MKKLNLFIFLIFFLVGCATHDEPTYVEQLAQRPYPATQQGTQSECTWIRSEIARMQNLSAALTTSRYALIAQMAARNNISALESRAANLKCGAAFSTTHIIEKQKTTSSIDKCITACKENTNRTSEQCFDACNK